MNGIGKGIALAVGGLGIAAVILVALPRPVPSLAWPKPAAGSSGVADDWQAEAMALVGQSAPDFSLADIHGSTYSLRDQLGSVLLVAFWATWCGPCGEVLPQLAEIRRRFAGEGCEVLAVHLADDPQRLRAAMADRESEVPLLVDTEEAQVAERYGVQMVPTLVLIGRDACVRRVWVGFGPETASEIQAEIRAALTARGEPDGSALFARHCSACHGEGRQLVASTADVDPVRWARQHPPAAVEELVRRGRPHASAANRSGLAMPAIGPAVLNDAALQLVIGHLQALAQRQVADAAVGPQTARVRDLDEPRENPDRDQP